MQKTTLLLAVALLLPWPAMAQEATFTTKNLTLETALKMAQAALKSCRDSGYQIAVAVVDRGGNTQVVLRDRFAGPHTPSTAQRKAWTAVSFRGNTSELADATQAGSIQSGMRDIPGALALGGGLVVDSAGSMVGAIGVSGAPGGALDDACAQAGIDAVADDLAF
ncbi:MAG: heme-binding protein [Gammaproteobacteria bacterium]|jgi:uncharacterized protein GlcG (DUF336 family)|nr:heme-binding protein [Gammaproteobacteria bacterium]